MPKKVAIPKGATIGESVPIPQGATIGEPAAPAEKPREGFVERGGGDLLDAVKGVGHLLDPRPQDPIEELISKMQAPLPLFRAVRGYYEGTQKALERARSAADKGNTAESMIESTAAGLPLVGPLVSGIYEQSGKGDVAGDVGVAGSRILQAASMAPEGSVIPNPVSAVLNTPGKVAAKVKEALPATARAADTALPWILKPKETAFKTARAKLREIGKPKEEPPVAEPEPTTTEVPSAPYRLSGDQITQPVTVTPRPPFKPAGLLMPGPSKAAAAETAVETLPEPVVITPLKGKTPAAQQAEVFKKMGVAAPKASVEPMESVPSGELTPRTDMTFPGVKSGESAALHQLADYRINELRAIAAQRGIQFKAADTHGVLIKRIANTLTEDEIANFADAAAETQRFQKLPWKRTMRSKPQVPTSDGELMKLLKKSVKEASAQR